MFYYSSILSPNPYPQWWKQRPLAKKREKDIQREEEKERWGREEKSGK